MTNQYTPIDLSRLIQSKVPEVRTDFTHTKWEVLKGDTSEIVRRNTNPHFNSRICFSHHCETDLCYAYRLDDVLRAIEEHVPMSTYNDGEESEEWEYQCHRLLTAYLEDGLQFGPRSEEVIRSIFT